MKRLILILLTIFAISGPSHASALSEKADDAYYKTVKKIELIKDESQPLVERQKQFKQLAEEFVQGDGSEFQTIKDGLLDILVDDPSFFFSEMRKSPEAFSFWKEKFSLHWMNDSPNEYEEIKALALKKIENDIRNQEERLEMEREALQLIRETPVTKLD